MLKRTVLLFAALLTIAWAGPVDAQTRYLTDRPTAPKAKKKEFGWKYRLKASANLSFSHNSKVVGQADGANWTLGFLVDGGLDYTHKGGHVWTNALKWQLTYTRTPVIDRFAKSLDAFDLVSSYLYRIPKLKWFGPYASFTLKTALLPGYTVKAQDVTVKRLDSAGALVKTEHVKAQQEISLTLAFAPTMLRQSIGAFAEPVNRKDLRILFQLGLGAWETMVSDGYTLADDEATPELEIKALQNSVSFGAEINAEIRGTYRKLLNYGLKITLMLPFVHNIETKLSGIDLLAKELEASLGFKLTRWASLDYTFKAVQLPLVAPDWQIQNGMLLTLTANLI